MFVLHIFPILFNQLYILGAFTLCPKNVNSSRKINKKWNHFQTYDQTWLSLLHIKPIDFNEFVLKKVSNRSASQKLSFWTNKNQEVFFFLTGTAVALTPPHIFAWRNIYSGHTFKQTMEQAAKPSIFWKSCWKLSRKMRLDALIIFPIEWHHNIIFLIGKRSKYCRGFFWYKARKDAPRRADHFSDCMTSHDDHFEG